MTVLSQETETKGWTSPETGLGGFTTLEGMWRNIGCLYLRNLQLQSRTIQQKSWLEREREKQLVPLCGQAGGSKGCIVCPSLLSSESSLSFQMKSWGMRVYIAHGYQLLLAELSAQGQKIDLKVESKYPAPPAFCPLPCKHSWLNSN